MKLLDRVKKAIAILRVKPKPRNPFIGQSVVNSRRVRGTIELGTKNLAGSCISKRAGVVANWNYTGQKRISQTQTQELQMLHWCSELLQSPSEYWTRSEIIRLISMWLDVNGNAFVITPKVDGVPVAMWVVNPQWVSIVLGTDELIRYYTVRTASDLINVPIDEMMHFRMLGIGNDQDSMILGKGLVSMALDALENDSMIYEYIDDFFSASAQKPLVLKTNEEYDSTKWLLYKQAWNTANPKFPLRGLLEGGMEVAEVGDIGTKVELDTLDQNVQRKIALAFQVPLGILTGEWTNRATADIQVKHFMSEVMQERANYIAEVMTKHFRTAEKGIEVVAERYKHNDVEEERKQEEFDLEHGIVTINDLRKKRGYQPTKDGDSVLVSSSLVPLAQLLTNPIQTNPQEVTPKRLVRSMDDDSTDTAEYRVWKTYDDIGEKNSKRLSKVIAKEYGKFFDEILSTIQKNYKGNTVIKNADDVLNDFDVEGWKELLTKAIRDNVESASVDVLIQQLDDLGLTATDADFYGIVEKAVEPSVLKITDPIATIVDDVRRIVAQNATLPQAELMSLLKKEFAYYKESGFKAQRIARTTSTFVTGATQVEAFTEFDISSIWLTQRDGKTRATHKSADGTKPDNQGLFNVGADKMKHPCGGSIAGENVNCRCVLFGTPKSEKAIQAVAQLNFDRAMDIRNLAKKYNGGLR